MRCSRVTGTISGGSLTGTGVRNPNDPKQRDLPFSATISGGSLTGRMYADSVCDPPPDTSTCYWDFTLTQPARAD